MADQSPPAPPLNAYLSQIESIDSHVDHANRVALDNEIISGHLPSRKACLDRTKNRHCENGRFWREAVVRMCDLDFAGFHWLNLAQTFPWWMGTRN